MIKWIFGIILGLIAIAIIADDFNKAPIVRDWYALVILEMVIQFGYNSLTKKD